MSIIQYGWHDLNIPSNWGYEKTNTLVNQLPLSHGMHFLIVAQYEFDNGNN